MKNNLKIGITGGIGSGKTVVCQMFGILGVPIYDADSRARYLTNNDIDLKSGIIELFGERAYSNAGLNNQWIAGRVFSDKNLLEQLNSLIHPRVADDFIKWEKENKGASYVIKEAALLYESGSYRELDKIIVITAPEELRIQRILNRDPHRDQDQIRDIINRQWPESKKEQLADYTILNDDQHLLVPQVLALHERFNKSS